MILCGNMEEAQLLEKTVMAIDTQSHVIVLNEIPKAYQIALEQRIDLFFVDVVVEEKSIGAPGMVFIGELRKLPCYHFTPVIFLSSLEDAKLYAYTRLNCYRYVERPYDIKKLEDTIRKALTFPGTDKKTEYVFFRNKGIFFYFKIAEIIYIENIQRRVFLHSVDQDVELSYLSCRKNLAHLNSDLFLQCSKNTIVNLEYIKNIDYTNRYLEIKGKNIKIEIGSVYIKEFRKGMKERVPVANQIEQKSPDSSVRIRTKSMTV